jgi:hypothetical protein
MRLEPIVLLIAASTFPQIPELPTLQVCNGTQVTTGDNAATVAVAARTQAGVTGTFSLRVRVNCSQQASGYPDGAIGIAVSMSDSAYNGLIEATTIEQVTSTGKHTPIAFLNGRCKGASAPINGCRFWLMMADNKGNTPDVAAFLVIDRTGRRIAYGCGPLRSGDITVADTPN